MSRKELTPTDPTPDEMERAKRWAIYHDYKLEESNYRHKPHWNFFPLPKAFDGFYGATKGYFTSPDAAWTALALALRPVFASVGPVIREDIAKFCEQSDKSTHPSDIADAIRAMK